MKINNENYKEVLISYLENELSPSEKAEVDRYILENEEAAMEWHLLNRSVLRPDFKMVFPDKKLLFRSEDDVVIARRPVVMVRLMRYSAIAIAASALLFSVFVYVNRQGNGSDMAQNGNHKGTSTTITHERPYSNKPETKTGSEMASADPGTGGEKATNRVLPKTDNVRKKTNGKTNGMNQKKKNETIPQPQQNPEQKHQLIITAGGAHGMQMASIAPVYTISETNEGLSKDLLEGASQHKMNLPAIVAHQAKVLDEADDNKNMVDNFMDFMNKVSLKKKKINDKTYYALSLETSNIKIDKTFKSFLEQ